MVTQMKRGNVGCSPMETSFIGIGGALNARRSRYIMEPKTLSWWPSRNRVQL